MITHPFPPLYDGNSKILILGSFPSVKSREQMFFYGHPQNRFWRVLAAVLDCPLPETVEEKRELLLANGVALWDAVYSCDIEGSADSTIKNVVPSDLSIILEAASVKKIFTNGQAAHKYFAAYSGAFTDMEDVRLPSTSPANAAWSLPRLIEAWSCIKSFL